MLGTVSFEINAAEIIAILALAIPLVIYLAKMNTAIAVMRQVLDQLVRENNQVRRHIEKLYERTTKCEAEQEPSGQ